MTRGTGERVLPRQVPPWVTQLAAADATVQGLVVHGWPLTKMAYLYAKLLGFPPTFPLAAALRKAVPAALPGVLPTTAAEFVAWGPPAWRGSPKDGQRPYIRHPRTRGTGDHPVRESLTPRVRATAAPWPPVCPWPAADPDDDWSPPLPDAQQEHNEMELEAIEARQRREQRRKKQQPA